MSGRLICSRAGFPTRKQWCVKMTKGEFERRVMATKAGGSAAAAAYLHMVGGVPQAEAARRADVGRAAVCRVVKRLKAVRLCEHCGAELR